MREALINRLSEEFGIPHREIIEKDVYLHMILAELCSDPYFSANYVFKGGTCLVKAHLGYYRFSEDIDFTYRPAEAPGAGRTKRQVRRHASAEAEKLGAMLEGVARRCGLEFRNEKGNTDYCWFGGGGKMLTLFLWYDSAVTGQRAAVKFQVNFVEDLLYEPEVRRLSGMAAGDGPARPVGGHPYFTRPEILVYSLEEIFCEKIRSMLTRRAPKARDFVDAYQIRRAAGIGLGAVRENAIKKIRSAMADNEKYRNNVRANLEFLDSPDLFGGETEEVLLIDKIDEAEFGAFMEETRRFLKESIVPALDAGGP